MPRYFIEVSYKGTNYAGFQVQQNANSIQAEVTNALQIYFHQQFTLTCSSRTDTGVHALQNYFHFDLEDPIRGLKKFDVNSNIVDPDVMTNESRFHRDLIYHINSILPRDIVVKKLFPVDQHAHCRFDAIDREYKYFIYRHKDPFIAERAYFYPFTLDINLLDSAAKLLLPVNDFSSFSKKHSQAKDSICILKKSEWIFEHDVLIYNVSANRFLRGMVKGLVGTMLQVARGKMSLDDFKNVIQSKQAAVANFSVPPHALFLCSVNYDEKIFNADR